MQKINMRLSLLLARLLLFITLFRIIGLMLGTLISFQVVIGDLSPPLINSAFGIEVCTAFAILPLRPLISSERVTY